MNANEIAKGELIPMLESLVALLEEERESEAAGFFRSVAGALEHAQEEEDLADGFMRLSMSAFLGFRYSRSGTVLLDQILESAQRLSQALSAGGAAGSLH